MDVKLTLIVGKGPVFSFEEEAPDVERGNFDVGIGGLGGHCINYHR